MALAYCKARKPQFFNGFRASAGFEQPRGAPSRATTGKVRLS